MPASRPACRLPAFEPLEPRLLLSSTLTFLDAEGGEAKARLKGNGAIVVLNDELGVRLSVTGADRGTKLTINGDGRVLLDGIIIDGAIKSITGKSTDLSGDLTVTGAVDKLTLGDFLPGEQKTISIGGTSAASAISLKLGNLVDVHLDAGAPIKKLTVLDWDDTDADDTITTPLLDKVSSKGDFAAGARLADEANTKQLLGKLKIKGELAGTWHVDNGADKLAVGSVGPGFSMNVVGPVKNVASKGDFAGDLAATELDKLQVKGSVLGGRILAGADLGDDARFGGEGADADLFFQGRMKKADVKGEVANGVIAVGLDPVDGVFGNGDDVVTGKQRSELGGLKVRGAADSDSRFAAGRFGKKVQVNGVKILPAGDPRFLLASTAPDTDPPQITAELVTILDTQVGVPVTNDPSIVGRVTDLGRITSFTVGVDDQELDLFEKILKLIEPNGTFELPRSTIEDVNGEPLTLGEHTVNFVARDDDGNTTAVFPVRFILTA